MGIDADCRRFFKKNADDKEEASRKKSKSKGSKEKGPLEGEEENEEGRSEKEDDEGEEQEDEEEDEGDEEETNDKIVAKKRSERKRVQDSESDLDSSRYSVWYSNNNRFYRILVQKTFHDLTGHCFSSSVTKSLDKAMATLASRCFCQFLFCRR